MALLKNGCFLNFEIIEKLESIVIFVFVADNMSHETRLINGMTNGYSNMEKVLKKKWYSQVCVIYVHFGFQGADSQTYARASNTGDEGEFLDFTLVLSMICWNNLFIILN